MFGRKVLLTVVLILSFSLAIGGLTIKALAQSKDQEKHFPTLPGEIIQNNNSQPTQFTFPQVIFIPLTQTIPAAVMKTKNDSLVAVKASVAHLHPDQVIYRCPTFGAGFVAFDNYVLTCLHLMGEFPAIWADDKNFPLDILVSDAQSIFISKLVYFDYRYDLALLKVEPAGIDGQPFSKKPAVIAQATCEKNKAGNWEVPYEKFYAFSFSSYDPRVFRSLQLGPIRSITNVLEKILNFPMAEIQGTVEPGFSGGPLLAPDGKVMGVVARSSPAYSYVILVEIMQDFLASAKETLKIEKDKPLPSLPAPVSKPSGPDPEYK